MPGWDDDTWGLHGDDGGIYHADGWRRERSDEWKYGTDDVVGVCVDPRKQTAFYTKNGEVIGECATAEILPRFRFSFAERVHLIVQRSGSPTCAAAFSPWLVLGPARRSWRILGQILMLFRSSILMGGIGSIMLRD
jgi:hypothetical protein